jgi:3-deoxy-D-manno-octulosonic-acid transferase
MRNLPFTLSLYRAAASAAGPFAPLLLAARRLRGKEDARRHPERRGLASRPRPKGAVIWLHGASVGEAVTILPLADRLSARGLTVLITSGTVTSASVVARRLPRGAIHQYVPLDIPAFVGRFLDHWQPDMVVFAESELWPSMITEAHERHLPLVLVNARMSNRSFERWKRFPRTVRALLGRFELCLAQSRADARRFAVLDAPRVSAAGNLKFDAPPPPADRAALAALQTAMQARPLLLAASTHAGEEAIVAAAHHRLKERFPDLLTIIAPRHPDRGEAVAGEVSASGLTLLQRSRGFLPQRGTEVYLADTMGELGLFYRLSRVVFVGGSLVPRGGQNPIEAAKLACSILHGPHVHNFIETYAALDEAGGARRVTDAASLAAQAEGLLADPAAAAAMAEAGGRAVASLAGALDRTMAALDPYLMQLALERR